MLKHVSRILGLVVGASALALSLAVASPLAAYAQDYNLWVGGTQVTSENASDVFGNGTVSYDASTGTLTLKKATIKGALFWYNNGSARQDGIFDATGKLTINLVGKSTLTSPYHADALRNFGIDCMTSNMQSQGALVVKGSGTLVVSAEKAMRYSSGILADKLTVQGSAKLVSKGAYAIDLSGSAKRGGYGIAAKTKLLVKGKAKLTAQGSTAAFYGSGFATPKYASGYTPLVKAGASAKKIKVNKKKPSKSVYTKYKYVAISKYAKAKKAKKAKKTSAALSGKPAKVKLLSLTKMSRQFQVEWKPLTKNCSGYQMQVAEKKSFPKNETRTYSLVKGKKWQGCYAWDLTPGTRYYVRVHAYNKVNGKKVWGAYSNVLSEVATS